MEEDVVILRVDTGEAVKSVADLKFNISEYKKILNETEIGTDAYKEALDGLTESQNALRGAMNANTASLTDVTAAAKGLGTSYNALVNQMARLKKEWRATTDEARRAELSVEIAKINTQLKDLDAGVGNFQRNVGNYTGGIKGYFDALGKGAMGALPGMQKLSAVSEAFSKHPWIVILGLVAGLMKKVIDRMKETAKGGKALNETLDTTAKSLQPISKIMTLITNLFDGLIEQILPSLVSLLGVVSKVLAPINAALGWLFDLIADFFDYLSPLIDQVIAWFDKITPKVIGFGNVILQAILAPIRSVIEAARTMGKVIGDIFTGEWSKIEDDMRASAERQGEIWKKAFDGKVNYALGEQIGERFVAGLIARRNRKKVTEAARETVEPIVKTFDEIMAIFDKVDKRRAELMESLKKMGLELFDSSKQAAKEWEAVIEEVSAEEKMAFAEEDAYLAKLEARAETRKKMMASFASATADILGSLADVYEANADQSAASERRIKNLRIAAATISTIQGAIGAFAQASATIPPPYGQIVGAASAAAVTAAGLANIAKMRSTSLSGSSSSSASTASASFHSASVSASAPVQAAASPTAMATLANDTEILNRMGNQRVYILSSDIEASSKARRVQVAETTF